MDIEKQVEAIVKAQWDKPLQHHTPGLSHMWKNLIKLGADFDTYVDLNGDALRDLTARVEALEARLSMPWWKRMLGRAK